MSLCCIIDSLLHLWPLIFIAVGLALFKWFKKSMKDISGKHVIVTGGSSGIGLCVAHDVLRRGANVTILARDLTRLSTAQIELQKTVNDAGLVGKIQMFSLDLAGNVDHISSVIKEAEDALGPTFMLVNCAGFSRADKFEDLSPQLVKSMMEVNYFGSFFVSQSVVHGMKERGSGIIVFTSSMAGLLGLYGFTAYAGCKGALVRMAEALHMEVKPHGISVTVSFPPDTDTPGYEEENKTKPHITKLLSETSGLFKPEEVAHKLVEDSLAGHFMSGIGLEGFMLTNLCSGMGPITDSISFLSQVLLMGIFRAISAFYLFNFDRIIRKETEPKKLQVKKSE